MPFSDWLLAVDYDAAPDSGQSRDESIKGTLPGIVLADKVAARCPEPSLLSGLAEKFDRRSKFFV